MGQPSPSSALRTSAVTVGVKSRPGRDVAEVIVELVGAGDHVGAAFEGVVEHDGEAVGRAASLRR